MAAHYRLLVLGRLEGHLARAIDGFAVVGFGDGCTSLAGEVPSQADLHRALRSAQALGIPVVDVTLCGDQDGRDAPG